MFDAGVILQKALIQTSLILSLSLYLIYSIYIIIITIIIITITIIIKYDINIHVYVYIVFGETTGGVCFFRFQGEELIPTRCI